MFLRRRELAVICSGRVWRIALHGEGMQVAFSGGCQHDLGDVDYWSQNVVRLRSCFPIFGSARRLNWFVNVDGTCYGQCYLIMVRTKTL